MRQFDVLANPSTTAAQYAPYLVVLQSHHLAPLDSVILAPVVRDAERALSPLDIAVEIQGEALTLAISELASVYRADFGQTVASVAEHEDAIRRALDRLFTGF